MPRLQTRGLVGLREIPLSEPRTSFASIFGLAGLVPSLAVIRRTAFTAAGGWDAGFGQGYEDTDMFLRLGLQGEVLLCSEALLRRRIHPAQSTSRLDHHWRMEHRPAERWRNLDGRSVTDRRMILAGWRLRNRALARSGISSVARRRVRERQYASAARALLGAASLLARSWVMYPERWRRKTA
jgi:GT2 family glycosyltransferase